MEADFEVCEQEILGLPGALVRRQRQPVMLEGRDEIALPFGWVARAQGGKEARERLVGGPTVGEQREEPGKLGADLLEDLQIAAGHGRARPLEGGRGIHCIPQRLNRSPKAAWLRAGKSLALREHLICPRLRFRLFTQQTLERAGEVLAPDALPCLAGGPGGKRAPVCARARKAGEGRGKIVIREGDLKITNDGVRMLRNASDVLARYLRTARRGKDRLAGLRERPVHDRVLNPVKTSLRAATARVRPGRISEPWSWSRAS